MIDLLKAKISQELPGIKAHQEMVPKGRSLTPESSQITPKKSAVLALMHYNGIQHEILFIQRTRRGKHGGQIAFPGGRVEPEDPNLYHTALRETHEEVGVKPDNIISLGALTEVYIPVSNYIVQPYIGVYDHDQKPQLINEIQEVDKSFWAPLKDIHTHQEIPRTSVHTASGIHLKNIPYFEMNGHVVWGATALILNEIRHLTASLELFE